MPFISKDSHNNQKTFKKNISLIFIGMFFLTGITISRPVMASVEISVLKTYADIAEATYEDALVTAKSLQNAITLLTNNPTEVNLEAAKKSWLAARVPYQQTEAYRFGNAIVDEWEGKVNAWPLDEGLIDYVNTDQYGSESDENSLYAANVIANPTVIINGKTIDAGKITKRLIEETLHEAGGIEANVATGYHAIEFLLWGQDLNGAEAGSGNRPATDLNTLNCSNGNCDRRVEYLIAVTDLLVDDLEEMVSNWRSNGTARKNILYGNPKAGLASILSGLGSLSYGELAGERIQLGLMPAL